MASRVDNPDASHRRSRKGITHTPWDTNADLRLLAIVAETYGVTQGRFNEEIAARLSRVLGQDITPRSVSHRIKKLKDTYGTQEGPAAHATYTALKDNHGRDVPPPPTGSSLRIDNDHSLTAEEIRAQEYALMEDLVLSQNDARLHETPDPSTSAWYRHEPRVQTQSAQAAQNQQH